MILRLTYSLLFVIAVTSLMATALTFYAGFFVGCRIMANKQSERTLFVERSDRLREMGVVFKDWRIEKKGTRIVGRMTATKQSLDGFHLLKGWQGLRATAYDKDGAEIHGITVDHPSLAVGEIGDITITLEGSFTAWDVAHLVLDVK